jgi:hypothetical protein
MCSNLLDKTIDYVFQEFDYAWSMSDIEKKLSRQIFLFCFGKGNFGGEKITLQSLFVKIVFINF